MYEFSIPMMYLFMGGVFSSIVAIPNGQGRTPLQQFGIPFLLSVNSDVKIRVPR